MSLLKQYTGLYTDLYELTMAQGYFRTGRQEEPACFDYFFRENPFDGGYVIFAGLEELLEMIQNFRFDPESLEYLRSIGFQKEFLDFLQEFRFKGKIHAPKEGEVVFPQEPIMRVEGTLLETQLLESLILNHINFYSLIATKAARIRSVAGDRLFADFGLRRAQGIGGIQASVAAVIGGANSTSNVWAGKHYNIPVVGTQAHSWIQSYDDELTAFRDFAKIYPENSILLVDTYNTLESGIPNAIQVARELKERGHQLKGIRLDSGDLAYFSKKARKMLDDADLKGVIITTSNQLDEKVIKSLNAQEAPIDGFGVGTRLVTGQPSSALDGVYKMSMCNGKPRLKLSENVAKISLPGTKKVYRYFNEDGTFYGDGIALETEEAPSLIQHPHFTEKKSKVGQLNHEPLHEKVMENGAKTQPNRSLQEKAEFVQERLARLPEEHKRFELPHTYKVGISPELLNLRTEMIHQLSS